jgi:hypothetical protein
MPERVADLLSAPLVGHRYRVPCVRSGRMKGSLAKANGLWIPVITPGHVDPELGVEIEHFHFDFRFIGKALWKIVANRRPPGSAGSLGYLYSAEWADEGPTEQVKRCLWEAVTFPHGRSAGSPTNVLEPRYADQILKPNCLICPHRGTYLGDQPVRNGARICPAHGLAWCAETGRMIPRADLEARRA